MASILKSKRFWVWTVTVAVALAAAWHFATRPPIDSGTSTVLAGATRVEVFRTEGMKEPPDGRRRTAGGPRIGGFLIIGRGQDQGKDFAARLADILFARDTYSWSYAACYMPGVAFRVWKGEEAVDVLICFKCDNFYCGPPTDQARETASFHGTLARSRLIRLAQQAFPDDKEIQELKAE